MIFKGNKRTYFTVEKTYTKEQALRIANKHFKVRLDSLEIQSGKIKGDTLEFGCRGNVWVISRRVVA